MKYELAKELKEARFPQSRGGVSFIPIKGEMEYFIPTLSELIWACGDVILFKLPENNEWDSSEKGIWVASIVGKYLCADTYFIDTQLEGSTGSTPEEAVARLWLSLNKPQTPLK